MKEKVAVKCSQIRKSFGLGNLRFEVLHGIDLEVKSGELLMLVGPSGSGKTTLISIIAGILSHDNGHCELFGKDLDTFSDSEKTKFRGKIEKNGGRTKTHPLSNHFGKTKGGRKLEKCN